jgi:hypothetical protein
MSALSVGTLSATSLSGNGNGLTNIPISAVTGSLGGDLSGPLSNATVAALRGVALSSTPPTDSQVLKYDAGSSRWAPATDTAPAIVTGPGLIGNGTAGSPLSIASGGITNSMLQNSFISISAGSGLSGGGAIPLGGAATLSVAPNVALLDANQAFTGICTFTNPANSMSALSVGTLSATSLSGNGNGLTNIPISAVTGSLGGDLSGPLSNATVAALRGVALSSIPPTDGQVLKYDAGSNRWAPATDAAPAIVTGPGLIGNGTAGSPLSIASGGITNSMLQNSFISISAGSGLSGGGAVPLGGSATLSVGPNVALLDGNQMFTGICTFTNSANSMAGLSVGTLNATSLSGNGSGLTNIQISAISGSLGGDLSGPLSGATVKALRGIPLASTLPSDGQVLTYNGSLSQWLPATPSAASITTGPGLTGNGTPGSPLTIASGGVSNAMLQNSSISISAGSGLSGGGSIALGGTATLSITSGGITNSMLANPTITIIPGAGLTGGGITALGGSTILNVAPLNGDVTGPTAATSVIGIQGRSVSNVPPTLGQTLKWNGSQWVPSN